MATQSSPRRGHVEAAPEGVGAGEEERGEGKREEGRQGGRGK